MGDQYIKIIPENVGTTEAHELANKTLKYLIEQRIIDSTTTDCALGGLGYPPGENYHDILLDDYGLLGFSANGLEVTVGERTVFWADDLEAVKCPNCGTDIIHLDWGQAIEEWTNNTGDDQIACPNCETINSIVLYIFEPTWALGGLGLTFWNWGTFKETFFAELENLMGKTLRIVYGKM